MISIQEFRVTCFRLPQIILFGLLIATLHSFGQKVVSKYACDSSVIYDLLVSGATFSGTQMDREAELQRAIYSLDEYKMINGVYRVQFVVNCDGQTTEINDDLRGNTLTDPMITSFMRDLATENNWNPAVHRERRVPHRKMIRIEVKKGRIKELVL